jgi:hypothetical protein
MNGLPAWARITAQLGFPIVIAFVLLWLVQGYMRQIRDEARADQSGAIVHRTQSDMAYSAMVPLLRQICENVAKTEFARDRCQIEVR